MRHYFITGTSSGIGKAYAEFILENEADSVVTGISRREGISHPRFNHIALDLGNRESLLNFQFEVNQNATEVVLVNNAGYIGDIKRIGNASNLEILKLVDINVSAVLVLTNKFIQQVNSSLNRIVLNISSGAANYPIDAWTPYCSSKAAIEHFTACVANEQQVINGDLILKSISPGVVNTEMQEEIRKSNHTDFSRHEHFVNLHENGELADPNAIAKKLDYVLNHILTFESNSVSLREI